MQRQLPVRHAHQLKGQVAVAPSVHVHTPRPCHAQPYSAGRSCMHGVQQERLQPVSVAASDSVVTDPFAAEAEQTSEASSVLDNATAFKDLGVSEILMGGLLETRISMPSPIQSAAIPVVLERKNCAIQSFTGSGKTLAYLLPALTLAFSKGQEVLKAGYNTVPVQVLIVAPSQELAMQIVRVAKQLIPKGGRSAVQQLIGGASPRRQAEALQFQKPLVAVGTPGRVAEMIRMGALKVHECPLMILDEADQLMAPNFAEDLVHINSHAGRRPPGGVRQTVLVSATISAATLTKAKQYCPDPVHITVEPAALAAQAAAAAEAAAKAAGAALPALAPGTPSWGWGVKGWDGPANSLAPRTQGAAGGVDGGMPPPSMPPQLQHYYVVTRSQHKVDMLRRCIWALDAQRSLVFMNFQQRLKDTQWKLRARSMTAGALHGELDKLERQSLMREFHKGSLRTLIVSDVAARGIDVPDCDTVFNLELPSGPAHYAHRAGRTGRMGAPGRVVSIITQSERFVVDKMRDKLGTVIVEAHVSRGEFQLGPAPRDYSFEEDEASDKGPKAKAAKGSDASRKTSKGADGAAAAAAASASSSAERAGDSADDQGRGSSSSAHVAAPLRSAAVDDADGWPTLRTASAAAERQQPASSSSRPARNVQGQAGPGKRQDGRTPGAAAPTAAQQSAAPAKGAGRKAAAQPSSDSDSDDDDDDSDMINEDDLGKLASLTRSQLQSLKRAAPGAAPKGGSNGKARADLTSELQALRAEKERSRAAAGGGVAGAGEGRVRPRGSAGRRQK